MPSSSVGKVLGHRWLSRRLKVRGSIAHYAPEKRLQRFKRKTDTLHSRSRVIVIVSQQLRELEVDIKPVCQTHTHAQTDGQAENITPSSVHRLDGEGTKTFEQNVKKRQEFIMPPP